MVKLSVIFTSLLIFISCSNGSAEKEMNFREVILDKGAVEFSIMMPKSYQTNNKLNHSEFCLIGDCFVSEKEDGYINLEYYFFEQDKIDLEDSLKYMVFCVNYKGCKLKEYETLEIDKKRHLLTFYSFHLNDKEYYGCISNRVLNQNSQLYFRFTSSSKDNFKKRAIKMVKSISIISKNDTLPFTGRSL